jgi:hypothetical protein
MLAVFSMSAVSSADSTNDPSSQNPPVSGAAITPPYHTVTAGGGGCSVNVGLAFDGSRLLVSCESDSRIDAVSPTDGSLLHTYNIPGLSALGAMAWDGSRNVLYACSGEEDVMKVDLVAGTATKMFTSNGCFDGLAYDGSDNTFWASPDANQVITHYDYSGRVLSSHTFGSELGGSGNSGIAVGGSTLYLANDGGSQIYTSDKAFSSVTLFATLATRVEDMECDNVTFQSAGTTVMWVIDAYDRTVTAFSIPNGSCGFGGLPPSATLAVTKTVTPPPGTPMVPIAGTFTVHVACDDGTVTDLSFANAAGTSAEQDVSVKPGANCVVTEQGTDAFDPATVVTYTPAGVNTTGVKVGTSGTTSVNISNDFGKVLAATVIAPHFTG